MIKTGLIVLAAAFVIATAGSAVYAQSMQPSQGMMKPTEAMMQKDANGNMMNKDMMDKNMPNSWPATGLGGLSK